MITSPLYCYASHRKAIEVILQPILRPDVRIRSVDQPPYQLKGTRGGTFVMVVGHPDRVPSEIQDILRAHGFLVLALDDSYARAAAR